MGQRFLATSPFFVEVNRTANTITMSVGNDIPFSRVSEIIWISVFSFMFISVLSTLVFVLMKKRKVTEQNDTWLEKNKDDIMNEVLLHERFL